MKVSRKLLVGSGFDASRSNYVSIYRNVSVCWSVHSSAHKNDTDTSIIDLTCSFDYAENHVYSRHYHTYKFSTVIIQENLENRIKNKKDRVFSSSYRVVEYCFRFSNCTVFASTISSLFFFSSCCFLCRMSPFRSL